MRRVQRANQEWLRGITPFDHPCVVRWTRHDAVPSLSRRGILSSCSRTRAKVNGNADIRDKSGWKGEQLIPIPVDEKTMKSYEELKRFNVIFPAGLLNKIDKYRKGKGLKRSTLLRKAIEEFLEKHDVGS